MKNQNFVNCDNETESTKEQLLNIDEQLRLINECVEKDLNYMISRLSLKDKHKLTSIIMAMFKKDTEDALKNKD